MNKIETRHTCKNCGHFGYDVGLFYVYVGGHGDMAKYYCLDGIECRRRKAKKGVLMKQKATEGKG